MDFILNHSAEVSLAAHFILEKLKKSEIGYFAVDLVDETSIPRDLFDEAINLLVQNKDVEVKNHRMVLAPEPVPPFDPKPVLTWDEMKKYTR